MFLQIDDLVLHEEAGVELAVVHIAVVQDCLMPLDDGLKRQNVDEEEQRTQQQAPRNTNVQVDHCGLGAISGDTLRPL